MKLKALLTNTLLIGIFATGCKKEEKLPEYGCDSPVRTNVSNVSGTLYYDSSSKQISLVVREGSIFNFYQVCNPAYNLIEQLDYKTQDSIPVLFGGQLKAAVPRIAPANYS